MNYCHTCKRSMRYTAMPNHRAAHRRRRELCVITDASGTWEYDYRAEE